MKLLLASLVCCLLLPCCPSAIAGFVVSVDINSVECVPVRRSLTHVCDECRIIVSPSIANCDPPSTIVLKSNVATAVASSAHCTPTVVFEHPRSAFSETVLCRSNRHHFTANAPATFCHSVFKLSGLNDGCVPALAFALPCGMSLDYSGKSNNGQLSENTAIKLWPNAFNRFHNSFASVLGFETRIYLYKGVYHFE